MKTLKIKLPVEIDLTNQEAVTALSAQLYAMGKLSLGQAAEVAGFTKKAFMEILSNYGVSVFNYSAKDLEKDIDNARRYHR